MAHSNGWVLILARRSLSMLSRWIGLAPFTELSLFNDYARRQACCRPIRAIFSARVRLLPLEPDGQPRRCSEWIALVFCSLLAA